MTSLKLFGGGRRSLHQDALRRCAASPVALPGLATVAPKVGSRVAFERCWIPWARGLFGALITATALSLLLPTPAHAQAPQPNPCAFPDALRNAGEKDEARKAYVALLQANPELTCAQAGLAAVNATPKPDSCASADALQEAGDKEEARKAYVTLLQTNPDLDCAQTGLNALNTPTEPELCKAADELFESGDLSGSRMAYEELLSQKPDSKCAAAGLAATMEVQRLCAQGDRYDELHRNDDALSAYKSALGKNPNAQCAKDGVGEASASWLSRALSWIQDVLPKALILVGLVLLALFVLLLLAYFKTVHRFLSRYRFFRAIIAPRLTIDPFDDTAADNKLGTVMTGRVRERLQRFREETLAGQTSEQLDLSPTDEEVADLISGDTGLERALEGAKAISPHGDLVAGLVNLVYSALPIAKIKVSGILDPKKALGSAAVTLSLHNGARLEAAATLRGSTLTGEAEPPDYLRLAQPSAVWVQYEVARALGAREVEPDAAESYAYVREGIDRYLEGDVEAAREAYEQAVNLNRRNWAARVNLALLEARGEQRFDLATVILRQTADSMEQESMEQES